MELTPPNQRAVSQVMSVFTKEQQLEFKYWLAAQEETSDSSRLIFGHPYYLFTLDKCFSFDNGATPNIPVKLAEAIDTLQEQYSPNKTSYFIDSYLIFALDQQRRGKDITLIILPDSILSSLLDAKYSPNHFTPSEVRVLAQLISDPEIKRAAAKDNLKVSTKETHYKSAANKIGGHKRIGVIADLTALLLLEITVASRPLQESSEKIFNEYRERYLPSSVKLIKLTTTSGAAHRFLDMGSKSGKVVIVLHPMILPDFRDQDIKLLHKLNLRLVWPLRHGFLEPDAKSLTIEEQLQDSIISIELAREHYCDEPFILAAMITSAWYSIRYAEKFPKHIKSLIFAGACHRKNQKKVSPVRQFGGGLITLATNNLSTTNFLLSFAEKHFSKHKRFRALLETVYSESDSDLAILDLEMSRQGFEGRYFFALRNSFRSLRHDLLQQANMGWERLRFVPIAKHFIHGDDNAIHTTSDIEHLLDTLSDSKLHVIRNCGQLMYYKHFDSLARITDKI